MKLIFREFEPSKNDLRKLREWLMKMPHLPQDYGKFFKRFFKSKNFRLKIVIAIVFPLQTIDF